MQSLTPNPQHINDAPRAAPGENVAATMSSLEIAELTGKRHDHVMRDIRNMLAELKITDPSFGGSYQDSTGRSLPCFNLDRELTETLITGYSIPLRHKVIRRLSELEAQHAKSAPVLPQDYIGALESLLESKKSEQAAIAERDLAIATKALIGSKREATAMATASSAVKKASHLANELGRGALQATMIAVEKANSCTYGKQGFRPLKKWCKANDITAAKVPCPRYGEASAWPAAAWLEVYGVDLGLLFGGVDA